MSSNENYPSDPLAKDQSAWEQKMLEELDRLERSREIGEREEQERRLTNMRRLNWEEGWRTSEHRHFDY